MTQGAAAKAPRIVAARVDNSWRSFLPMQNGIRPAVPKKIESFTRTGALVLPSDLDVGPISAGGNSCEEVFSFVLFPFLDSDSWGSFLRDLRGRFRSSERLLRPF